MNPLILVAATAAATAAPFIGYLLVKRRGAGREAQDWFLVPERSPARTPAEPVDDVAIQAQFAALRARVSALADAPPPPFITGDPVVLSAEVETCPDDPIEGTVMRLRPAPPEVLVLWGNDDDARWHHVHELTKVHG
jgi:hypothetical protein